jgi:tetratricopeptide (TPR) repeat protein
VYIGKTVFYHLIRSDLRFAAGHQVDKEFFMTSNAKVAPVGELPSSVFISYSRKDAEFVDRLEAGLIEQGFAPKVDRAEIVAFEEWWKRIEELIVKADTIVFVLSPDAVLSKICRQEVAFAASLKKRFAPIVCRSVDANMVPEELARLNFIFFDRKDGFDGALKTLATALSTDIGWVRKHTEFGDAARRWELAGQARGLLLGSTQLEDAERWIAARPHGAPLPTEGTQAFIRESRRTLTRRRTVLTTGLAAGLALAVALSAFAGWQWWTATQQTKRANQNFAAARSAADELIIGVARNLRNVRGMSQQTTLLVLTPAEKVMDKLVADSNDNPDLLLSRVSLFQEFSKTFWFVGDIANARKYVGRGLSSDNALLALKAYRPDAVRYRYEGLMIQGDIMRVQGELENSLASFQGALGAAQEALVTHHLTENQALRELASAHGRIGDVMRTAGRFAEAANEYSAAETIQRKVLRSNPDDAQWLGDLSISFNRMGDNLLQITNHEGLMTVADDRTSAFKSFDGAGAALDRYQDSLKIRRELVEKSPANNERRRDLVWGHALVGMALLATDTEQSRKVLRDGLDEVTELLKTDEKNTEWLRYRALIHNFIGDSLLLENRRPEAFAQYEEGVSVRQQLVAIDPNNARWVRDLFYTFGRMVELHRIVGQAEQAESYRQLALKAAEQAQRTFPTDGILAGAATRLRHKEG